ncbi:triphosphoribosyl-dephospho-CoA synthase MdcB [Rhizobium leguminosarum]|uniref:triphosphoribosyl-dephospho-CoA synthase MdcB n=1 Tax=Rhizobium leguminosarum TaxID=384 RepID=UPI001FEF53B5|nr:triphosphoribosyl-dephospho-CoA synthase MdcB [Rhizobium leguminosarum]
MEIAACAVRALHLEVDTYPKPGLVSPVDAGAHADMDAALLRHSANVLGPYFADLAAAGAAGAKMNRLRIIGIEAERAMLHATGGVNTHRGAIFGLGLLVAAAGFRSSYGGTAELGRIVADRWGDAILSGPVSLRSHGAEARRRYGAGGARMEAASGFPSVYDVALPALAEGELLAPGEPEAARVHACFALIATIMDTNLLHRGGSAGLAFARGEAETFLAGGGVGAPQWQQKAVAAHVAFIARNLSPGGAADILAMALFVRAIEYRR